MDDTFKKLLYMAVGVASTSDKVRMLLNKAEVEGKITQEEGKRIVEELWANGVTNTDSMLAELKLKFADIMSEISTPTTKEFDALKQKVADLEKKLAEKTDKPNEV